MSAIMNPAASAASPLQPLRARLNTLILAENNCRPHLLRQLLQLHARRMPEGLLQRHEVNFNFPAEKHIHLLPVIGLVSVLFRTKGPWATRKSIAELNWNPLLGYVAPPLPNIDEIQQFSEEISSLTDGVITTYTLNPCRALFIMFTACIARCKKRRRMLPLLIPL